jgi:phage tail-like protein
MTTNNINTIDQRGSLLTDPLRNFRFKAEFTPVSGGTVFNNKILTNTTGGFTGGFSAISGLSITTNPIAYREGGYNTTVHQIPGMVAYTPVTFSRGVLYGNDQAITWMRGLNAAAAGEGLSTDNVNKPSSFRCNVKISLMDHPNADGVNNDQRMTFILRNAWISALAYSDFSAAENQLFYETMTLVHEGMSVAFVKSDGTALDPGNNPGKML